MRTTDYYELLGVSRSATQDTLRRAYHARVMEAHPDLNPRDATACDRTRRIVEAYSVLGDSQSRMRYDLAVSEPVDLAHDGSAAPARHAPDWLLRAMSTAAVLAVFVLVVMGSIQALLGDRGPVFRPNVNLLQQTEAPRGFPIVSRPDISDPAAWYAASRYQLGLASPWARHEMVQACSEAADRARQARDPVRTAFYAECIRQTENQGSATATLNLRVF